MPNPYRQSYAVSQDFGPTDNLAEPAYGGHAHFHRGIDLVCVPSAPIYAVSPGVVFSCGTSHPDEALYVIVKAHDGHYECFWHLAVITCHPGDPVTNTTQIG